MNKHRWSDIVKISLKRCPEIAMPLRNADVVDFNKDLVSVAFKRGFENLTMMLEENREKFEKILVEYFGKLPRVEVLQSKPR